MISGRAARSRPRITLGWLMFIIAIIAFDCALVQGIRLHFETSSLDGAILFVVLYDLLIILTYQALIRIIRPRPGERPSRALIVLTVIVLGLCSGIPFVLAF